LHGLTLGVATLETSTAAAFDCQTDWPAEIAALPFIALFRRGLRVESFSAFQVGALVARLQRLAFLPAPAVALAPAAYANAHPAAA
jgi:hypothetical protein